MMELSFVDVALLLVPRSEYKETEKKGEERDYSRKKLPSAQNASPPCLRCEFCEA